VAVVEIVDVIVYKRTSERLYGHYLDKPMVESQIEVYAIDIEGWVLGRSSQDVTAVEVVHEGNVVQRARINVHRPDVAVAYPGVPEAEHSGFRITVGVLSMEPEIQLFVQAVLQDESRVTVGVVLARRHPLHSSFQPKIQPLILTNLGRSGSTWLTRLLGQHPQIVTYRSFEYEPRVASYWMEVLRSLSDPASYLQSVLAEVQDRFWWLGNNRVSSFPLMVPDPVMLWLGRHSVEELAAFCQNMIETFYIQVAVMQGQSTPNYFAERYYGTSAFARMIMWELYPQTREIFLVRDLRDMLCSMFAFNRKTGITMFGREQVSDDQGFVYRVGEAYRGLLQSWKERSHKAYFLKYEDLIRDPEEALTSILDYLELDSSTVTVQHTLRAATEREPEIQQRHKTSPNEGASIGRWRRDLDPSLQAVCQEAFGDVLQEFGYAE
jgi:hypothetical protein